MIALCLYSLDNYWFCYENEKKKKKNYPQVYSKECSYKMEKTKMPNFINTELESESDSNSDFGSNSVSDSNSDSE